MLREFAAPGLALDDRGDLPAARPARARAGRRAGGDRDAGRGAGRAARRRDRLRPGRGDARGRPRAGGAARTLNVEFQVLNAEWIDLPVASVDAVLCRWGYMLMADPAAALRETRRVLAPGGRLALAVWDAMAHNPWALLPAQELIERGLAGAPDASTREPPGPFALGQARHAGRGCSSRPASATSRSQAHRATAAATSTSRSCGRPRSTSRGASTTPSLSRPEREIEQIKALAGASASRRTPRADGTHRDPRAHARRLRERLSAGLRRWIACRQ